MIPSSQFADEWGRLAPIAEAGNRAGVFMQGGGLRDAGIDPASLGLLELRESLDRGYRDVDLPEIPDIALSLFVPGTLQLIGPRAHPLSRNHTVMAAGIFLTEHPLAWLEALADHHQALLVVAPRPPHEFSTVGEWMTHWSVGLVPVAFDTEFDGFYRKAAA